MSSETRPSSRLSGIAHRRWFAILSVVLAAVLVVSAGVVAAIKFWPHSTDTQDLAEQAPVAFGTTIIAEGPQVMTRGDKLSLRIEVDAPAPVATLELWDGGDLYYTVDAPDGDVAIDYVPVLAGAHLLTARAALASGATSISSPLQLAVDDRPPATWVIGPEATPGGKQAENSVVVDSSPGDTPLILSLRLGIDVSKLLLFGGGSPTPPDPDTPLAPGTPILAPIVSQKAAAAMTGFGPLLPKIDIPTLAVSVTDCVATVTIDQTDKKWALYASTPLRPGMLRVGDVSKGAPFSLGSLPLGPTVFVAYRVGTTPADLGIDNIPTLPVQAVVPDDCLSRGWTGDAKVVNGVLITDNAFDHPYAYVSVDAGPWVRVPGAGGTSLENTQLNDVRTWLSKIKYDRADVEVWQSVNGGSQRVAEGHFCLKDVPGAALEDGSGSGSSCSPLPSPQPVDGGTGVPTVTLTASAEQADVSTGPFGTTDPSKLIEQQLAQASDATASLGYADDPAISQKITLDEDRAVTLTATATGTQSTHFIEFQFSFFPISPQTASLKPPGVFFTKDIDVSKNSDGSVGAQYVAHPWAWKDSKPEWKDSTSFQAGGDQLSLDDEIAYALAQQRLTQGQDLVEDIYVRAVPVERLYYGTRVTAPPSRNAFITMPPPAGKFTIDDAGLFLQPGLDTTAPDNAYGGRCLEVKAYPDRPALPSSTDPKIWTPYAFANNNWQMAHLMFPDTAAVYCLDPNAPDIRAARAAAEADDCGLGCILTGIVIGLAVGFATGGPVGAVIGALAGAALAFAAPGALSDALHALQELWDIIVQVYNSTYQAVLTLAAELNPICLQAKAIENAADASSTVSDVCKSVTKVVTSAAITYTTGLPPSLPTSSELVDIAQGKLSAVIELGMDYALSQVGLSCDDVSVDGGTAADLIGVGNDALGSADTATALDAARTPSGGYSLCTGVANLVSSEIRQEVGSWYNKTMSQLMETWLPDGMVTSPVTDTTPVLTIRGAVPQAEIDDGSVFIGQTCPAIVNMTVNTPIEVSNVAGPDFDGSAGHHSVLRSFVFKPISTTLIAKHGPAAGFLRADNWVGQVSIPVLPREYEWNNQTAAFLKKVDTNPDPSRPYLEVTVDSPCFSAVQTLTAGKFPGGSATWSAFQTDARTIRYYA